MYGNRPQAPPLLRSACLKTWGVLLFSAQSRTEGKQMDNKRGGGERDSVVVEERVKE